MKLVPIFDDQLYAVHYAGKKDNEWDNLLELWGDVEYLREFAIENSIQNVNSFIRSITTQADRLDDLLSSLHTNESSLDSFFKPLDNEEYKSDVLLSKRKGKWPNCSLRIYAIKIESNCYLITGGAIKMTLKMSDHMDTKKELPKLNKVRDYLIEQCIIDRDSFDDYLEISP